MEQVLAPNFKFKVKKTDDENLVPGTIQIKGFKEPKTPRVNQIIEEDLNDLKARILQDDKIINALPGNVDPEVINKIMIPKVIRETYPDLSEDEIEQVRQYVIADSVMKNGDIKMEGGKKFVLMANRFVNIDDLNIDLIDKINPFQKAFEILSKSVTTKTLRIIQDAIESTRSTMTEEEAVILYPKIKDFIKRNNDQKPYIKSEDPLERRLAEALLYIQKKKYELSKQ